MPHTEHPRRWTGPGPFAPSILFEPAAPIEGYLNYAGDFRPILARLARLARLAAIKEHLKLEAHQTRNGLSAAAL